MLKMNDIKDSGAFKSYIEQEFEPVNLNDCQTKLTEGETIACRAQRVLLFTPLSERQKSKVGILTITTFRLSFSSLEDTDPDDYHQNNLLLGGNDVCLSNVDTIYQLGDRTKKKLLPGQAINGKVRELLIICKNMKSYEFSFKLSEKDSGRSVAKTLVHHVYPKRHSLLFAYDFKNYFPSSNMRKEVRMFRKEIDWKEELSRTKCPNWRLHSNIDFKAAEFLGSTLIVPQNLDKTDLEQKAAHFRNGCLPVWVWGRKEGAALVRMSDLKPSLANRNPESTLLEKIRNIHPNKSAPFVKYLNSPTPQQIQSSYLKLRELCVPENARTFKSQDFKFYGLLDQTKWLQHVSKCLAEAEEAASCLLRNCTVVIGEENGNGQDLNCVISSLVQIMVDPHFRTKYGFQSLIQKDWIALGHPFSFRLGHILSKETEQSPVFLLFLDCVWQLLQQFPQAFQFSETYLTTVWDSAHITVFETFLFNCEKERVLAETGDSNGHDRLVLRSVWNWEDQFAPKDIELFFNPLYDETFLEPLRPNTRISSLGIWMQCYFRWLPGLDIPKGGSPQIDLFNRLLLLEIKELQRNPKELNGNINQYCNDYEEMLGKVNGFFPFSRSENDACMGSSVLLSGDSLDTQSVLNLNPE